MTQHQSSRRRFLKISALLPMSALLLSPAIAQLKEYSPKPMTNHSNTQSQLRADVRSLDFDSHDFMWNFR